MAAGLGTAALTLAPFLLGDDALPEFDPPTAAAYIRHGMHQPHTAEGSAVPNYVLSYATNGSNIAIATAVPAADPNILYRLVAAAA